jgi:transcriptional regulator GlxA family with amidase domain
MDQIHNLTVEKEESFAKGYAEGYAKSFAKSFAKSYAKSYAKNYAKSKVEIARKLLEHKVSIDDIIMRTGLSKEEVEAIKE